MKKKIGWQKYEDIIDSQINSPVLESIYKKMASNIFPASSDDASDYEDQEEELDLSGIIPIDPKVLEMATISTNFDCWMGHANFNLTEEVEKKLKKIQGVEILKICSRYRFFVGVGKMFDFTQVRRDIQKELLIDNDNEIQADGTILIQ